MNQDDEAERHRKAAELALDQLDWCVAYFRSIHKTQISTRLAKNRDAIRRRLREARHEDGRQA